MMTSRRLAADAAEKRCLSTVAKARVLRRLGRKAVPKATAFVALALRWAISLGDGLALLKRVTTNRRLTWHRLGRRGSWVAIAFALCAPLAAADYWVSIGAFRALDGAERLAADAGAKAGLEFDTLPVVVGSGRIHRVAAGPFASREEAIAAAATVRATGFEDAWIVEVDAAARTLSVDVPVSVDGDAVPSSESSERRDTFELPSIEELLEGLPDVPSVPATPPAVVEEPEEEEIVIPNGYQLHKLHREGAMLTPVDEATGKPGIFDMRVKWFTSAQSLPTGDVVRQLTGESTPLNHSADLRLMWRKEIGAVRLLVDHASTWIRTDIAAGSPGLTFDQTPTGDERRALDLTWLLDDGENSRLLHRFDRLAVEYRTQRVAITAGRQAVSWGGGLVFQPMDLLTPFAPTTVDQDYKAGDDLLLVERLFGDGSELQVLAVGRRIPSSGNLAARASSLATKYRTAFGESEVELMAAQHYDEQVLGVGLRVPIGGALVRSDLTLTLADDATTVSGVVNADYSFGVRGSIVHVFGEYFYNGFGVPDLPDDLGLLPTPLTERIARGELFNLMRSYLALGSSFRWHFLFNQSFALIANLHDNSYAAQASLTYDSGDASRLQVGLTKPFGDRGDEFGGVTVGEGLTVGGGAQGFVRFVYFF